jgi:hypothetical protein
MPALKCLPLAGTQERAYRCLLRRYGEKGAIGQCGDGTAATVLTPRRTGSKIVCQSRSTARSLHGTLAQALSVSCPSSRS